MDLSPPLAVEKVLYRLALHNEGRVTVARVFLELPFSLEEVENYADAAADGRSVVRNEYGEFLAYEFPELQRQMPTAPDDCPTCFGPRPPQVTDGGVELRRALICDECYAVLKRLHGTQPNETVMGRLTHFFRGEQEELSLVEVAKLEHEIFYIALRAELPQFTHTTVAAQSRRPAEQIKERLTRMAARRYLRLGLLPSGDAVAYSFPAGLDYPRLHYGRLDENLRPSRKLERTPLEDEIEIEGASPPPPAPKPLPKISAKLKRAPLKITIKSRRDRPADEPARPPLTITPAGAAAAATGSPVADVPATDEPVAASPAAPPADEDAAET